jgi:hypothetical protein
LRSCVQSPSATSATIFKAGQQPETRESAIAYNPKSRHWQTAAKTFRWETWQGQSPTRLPSLFLRFNDLHQQCINLASVRAQAFHTVRFTISSQFIGSPL